jgi:hypothetical protein
MSQRRTSYTNLAIRDVPFLGMWWSGREFGGSFGIRMKGVSRNVHLTVVLRDGVLNCHITDTAKKPEKIWEANMPIREFETISEEFMASCVRRYYWFQRYYQFSDSLLKAIRGLGNSGGMREYDMAPFFEAFLEKDIFVKKRIRKGFYEGQKIGITSEGDDLFFVIPFSRKNMIIMNSDSRKTPFGRTPTIQGISRYIDYVEEERILEQTDLFEPDRKKQIEAAFVSMPTEGGLWQ